MARQAERREATRGAILAAAGELFGRQGFAGASVDQIAQAAGLAKGAVYHHFATKEALFEAVFRQASQGLAARLASQAGAAGGDVLTAMAASFRAYFAACAEGPTGRIILKDGPAVLGWARWREIDSEHFGGGLAWALKAAMAAGLIETQPVEPLAGLLLGAANEAAVACHAAADPAAVGGDYARAFERLLEGLRTRP
ncbi:MAG TPA: TetR/AcrR family transcriptional regulator [Caulobacteraceae bacterium]|jgi:AcrR family transcriptional regulator|nr:TetR/AcrR family transcriptional regulator [Caulobacteraceae bacterium]